MEKETALKILRELHDKVLFSERTALETLIPELKESEDERIRKAIIKYLDALDDDEIRYGVSFKDMRAWLEKQDKQKYFDTDTIKKKAHQIAWEISKHYDPNACKQEWCEMAAIDMASWLEKQGEHKPTDKVEPKFREGSGLPMVITLGK